MAAQVFESLSTIVLQAVTVATAGISNTIISNITGLILICGTMYFTLMGYMIIGNYVQTPLSHFVKTSLRFGLIVGLVLFTGAYATQIVPALEGFQVALAALFSSSGAPLPAGSTIFTILDDGLEKAVDLALHVQQINRWFFDAFNSGLDVVMIIMILLVSLILFGKAASYIIIAQVMFLIMLAIGPLFILMLLFGGITAQWFDRWFGQTLTYMLQMALVSLVASLCIQIFSNILPSDPTSINFIQYIWLIVQMVAAALVLFVVLDEANSAAGQLAGGISSGAANLIATANAAPKAGRNISKSVKSRASRAGRNTKAAGQSAGRVVKGAYNAVRRNRIRRG